MAGGMVVTPHPVASDAAARVLRAGGMAVDAAVAAGFSLSVVTPASTGIAGYGGSALIYDAQQHALHAVDFDSRAPAAASPDIFPVRESSGGSLWVPGAANVMGAQAVDVPGVLAGLTLMQRRFGTLSLRTVIEPAIESAAEGYPIDEQNVLSIHETLVPNADLFPDVLNLFSVGGRVPEAGELLRNPALARALEAISRDGPELFYRGDIAGAIVKTVQAGGGRLTLDDLASYEAKVVEPLRCTYRGFSIAAAPLPMGGLTTLQMLRVLENFDVAGMRDDVALVHCFVEIAKACWRERLLRYGDPDHATVLADEELDERRITVLQRAVTAGLELPSAGEVISPDPSDSGTVHICAADCRGNVVTLTITHGGGFGSLVVVPGTGIVLGHGMSRFDPRPGRPNSVAPRKRPLNNMNPLLVAKDGRPIFVIGGSGGRTLLCTVPYAVVRIIDRGDSLAAALAATRFHVESAEPVQIEEGGAVLKTRLRRLGHQVRTRPRFGGVQALALGSGTEPMTAATDPRWSGAVVSV
ncbi:MAG TPA: gamma-glutamyltransferase family protein [bacterium]|nr:gamma-glutamyltransferase family protein [bacterium]